MKKIKIFLTIGPSSLNKKFLTFLNKKKKIIALIRINLSHVNYDDLEKQIKFIRKFTKIPICLDTEGAQIRTKTNKALFLKKNKLFYIYKEKSNLTLYPDDVFDKLKKNDVLNIGFEGLVAKIIYKDNNKIKLKVISDGLFENNKGVHLISRNLKLKFLTNKDYLAIALGKKLDIKNYALSFTNTIDDIKKFKKIFLKENKIYKIETKTAIKNITKFFKNEINFLIDRGDLSKSIGIENVPITQRIILAKAKLKKNIKISIATNFLESMIEKPFPTRAEVNDIYNALELGASNLVLAAETAIGKYPIECILLLEKLIKKFVFTNKKTFSK